MRKRKGVNEVEKKNKHLGKVYRGETKYIDPETKKQRNYVVVHERGNRVHVAKLKSVKKENDPALFEIDYRKYGLDRRTGVDFQRFGKNRMTNQALRISDRKVFPEESHRFKLTSHDTHRVILHTTSRKKKKPR